MDASKKTVHSRHRGTGVRRVRQVFLELAVLRVGTRRVRFGAEEGVYRGVALVSREGMN